MSANRGLCRQPCRRIYHLPEISGYFFSLKDNQLIDFLPEILKLNISGLKIEGRMRSAEYVYQVARAYRMVIDDPRKIEVAKEILKYDFGREKTAHLTNQHWLEFLNKTSNSQEFTHGVGKYLISAPYIKSIKSFNINALFALIKKWSLENL